MATTTVKILSQMRTPPFQEHLMRLIGSNQHLRANDKVSYYLPPGY